MTIHLIAVGKTDHQALAQLIAYYQERLKFYVKFTMTYIPDIKNRKNLSETEQKTKEGALLLKRLRPTDMLILLDEQGTEFDSVEFSRYLQKRMNAGTKQLVFAIGGPYGFSEAVYAHSQGKIALSKMTFSHQMVRLFFVEQLYRGFSILRNEPYHHQ